jgi:parvulin-like peptidyl-prolyl isomerase
MSKLLPPSFALAAFAALAAPAVAQSDSDLKTQELELRAKLREAREQILAERAEALQPVSVNGKQVSTEALKRAVVYLVGPRKVEAKITDLLTQEYYEQALQNGRSEEDFNVTEDDLVESLSTSIQQFQKENPGVEFWEAVRSLTGFGREEFLQQQRQSKLFDLVFFPGTPQEWPEVTREAIKAQTAGADGQKFWDSLVEQATDAEGNPKPLPPFWIQLCKRWVQTQLKAWSDIRFPSDGLEPGTVLSVNGREWSTDEAFEFVRSNVYLQDMRRAMKEVAILEALRQELVAKGAYLSDEDFQREYDEYKKPYEGSPFNVEVISTTFKGYPSLEAFRARWRLMRSYELMIADEVTEEELQKHAERTARFFTEGTTTVDVIPFLARSLQTGAWEVNGMEKAKERAEAALKRIQDGAKFDEVLTAEGEFFQNDKDRGRLANKGYNPMRQAVRETEFTDLLMGYSLGAYLFYDAPVGEIVGPLRGTDAYYIARVNQRLPARGKLSLGDERKRELVRQDYLTTRFLDWANEVVTAAKFE